MNFTEELGEYVSGIERSVSPDRVPESSAIHVLAFRIRRKRRLLTSAALSATLAVVALAAPGLVRGFSSRTDVRVSAGHDERRSVVQSTCVDQALPPATAVGLRLTLETPVEPLKSGASRLVTGKLTNTSSATVTVDTDDTLAPYIVSAGVVVADPGGRRGVAVRATLGPGQSREYPLTVVARACYRSDDFSVRPGRPLPPAKYDLYAQLTGSTDGDPTIRTVLTGPVILTVTP